MFRSYRQCFHTSFFEAVERSKNSFDEGQPLQPVVTHVSIEKQASTATFISSSSKRELSTSRRMSGRCHGEHYALNIQKGN